MEPLASSTGTGLTAVSRTASAIATADQKAGVPAAQSPPSGTAAPIKLPEDRVTLSGRRSTEEAQPEQAGQSDTDAQTTTKPAAERAEASTTSQDPQVQQQISRLKQTEEKVRAHEAAHKAAGGNLASAASYSYTRGPDGRSYITGGEVQIDMSDGQTPQETISRMQQVIRAALAPADPSGQDRAVAAQAAARMAEAQQQKLQTDSSPTAEEPERSASTQQEDAGLTAPADNAAQNSLPENLKGLAEHARQIYREAAAQPDDFIDRNQDSRQRPQLSSFA